MAKAHELKCWPEYFEQMVSGAKRFDVRFDDRGFEVGDTLELREFVPEREARFTEWSPYTGRILFCTVGYILRDFAGLQPGYVVLGLDRQSWWEEGFSGG